MATGAQWNRRELLLAGIGASAALSAASAQELGLRRVTATSLIAETSDLEMIDGLRLSGWRLNDLSASGPGGLSAGVIATDADDLLLTVGNDLETAARLEIPGVGVGPRVEPGSVGVWKLGVPPAGTYLLAAAVAQGSAMSLEHGLAMGLVAPLVVPAATTFDREYTLVLSDIDERFHVRQAAGDAPSLDVFEPNYYFINGLSHPDTIADESTRIVTEVGERILVRLVNAGLLARAMHSHGYHFEVLSRDRVPVTDVVDKDTVAVWPGECVDIAITVHQPGLYPLHDHYIPAVTANGVYVNPIGGALTLIEAS